MTFSFWFKNGNINTNKVFYGYWASGTSYNSFVFIDNVTNGGKIRIYDHTGSFNFELITSQVFRDPSAWYHLTLSIDTTKATASDRMKLYVNGEQITDFDTATYPSQNADCTVFNNSVLQYIGYAPPFGWGAYMDGYMSDFHFIDWQALAPDSFGWFEAETGEWRAKEYTGSYGGNWYKLEFKNSGNLGTDTSGNNNTWSVNSMDATDQMIDTPSNNFATLNPVASAWVLSEWNLRSTNTTYSDSVSSIVIPAWGGKYYFEWYLVNESTADWIGFSKATLNGMSNANINSFRVDYEYDHIERNGTWIPNTYSMPLYTTGDLIGVAIDSINGIISFYKNWVLVNTDTNSVYSSNDWYAKVGHSNSTWLVNFGQWWQAGLTYCSWAEWYFKYCPPTGYKTLSTANLPTPTIKDPSKHFDVLTYTGNASNQTVSGLDFGPDFVWIKNRSIVKEHQVFDTIRWVQKPITSDTTWAEWTDVNTLTGFNSNWFDLGYSDRVNGASHAMVAWNWKAGWAAVTNTDWTTTAQVSANPTAGFSIVGYSWNWSSSVSIWHGLSKKPDLIITKWRTNTDIWLVQALSIQSSTNYLGLDRTNSEIASGTEYHNITASTYSVNHGWSVNSLWNDYIAYLFHSVPGYSKIWSYTGNGNADGAFVYTGFKPKYVMVKNINASEHWRIFDSSRDTDWNIQTAQLIASSDAAEYTGDAYFDFLSNWFKLRAADTPVNGNGNNIIYIAFAEAPFKYANAR